MTKKLVWPATLLASFALASACGGGTPDDDGMGGEGGTDGSTGGSSTIGSGGTDALGGGAGEGGLGGGGPIIVVPLTCSDELQNEEETDIDCGGPACDPCEQGAACVAPADCESGVCESETCSADDCGDGIVNGSEECDDGRETAACDVDCTLPVCGDGDLNEQAGEFCEPDPDLDVWQRCGRTCIHGVDLDGTWRTNDLPGTNSPWERLGASPGSYNGYTGAVVALQSFHYIGQPRIYDVDAAHGYDIATDTWLPMAAAPGFQTDWANGATDSGALWIPRSGTMYRYDIDGDSWEDLEVAIPNATSSLSAAVFDGAGFIWFVGEDLTLEPVETILVRFDPSDGTYQGYPYSTEFPITPYETRMAYDPLSNKVLLAGYDATTFLIFDIETETFSQSVASPGGSVKDYVCQDRAGGVYVGATDYLQMLRYDVLTNEFHQLPALPTPQDNWSTCVVSEVGYLYVGSEAWGGSGSEIAFRRLRLNHH